MVLENCCLSFAKTDLLICVRCVSIFFLSYKYNIVFMSYIYNSPLVKIQKNSRNIYSIKSSSNNYFQYCLHTTNIQIKKDAVSTELTFTADSVISMQEYLDNKPDKLLEAYDTFMIIQDIIHQIQYLENNKKTISYFSLDDFLIINQNYCLFVGLHKVFDINSSGNFKLIEKIEPTDHDFLSPEMSKIKTYPSTIHYKSCYYSLGLLLLKTFVDVTLKTPAEFVEKTKPIIGLPTYWFIKNAIEITPKDRYILFI